MDDDSFVAERSLVEKVVLSGVLRHAIEGETPARLDEVRAVCNEEFADVSGRLSEGDVARSLNRLAADNLLEETAPSTSSPAGKGRPAYALEADPDAVLAALESEAATAPLAETLEER